MVQLLSVLRFLKTTPKSAFAASLALLAGVSASGQAAPAFQGPVVAGQLVEPKNQETSGLAVSHRTPGMLWTHNDSGGDPVLFAMNHDGTLRGRVRVAGVKNLDWEEMSSFELDGKAWLLIADIGDNFAMRTGCVLHVLPEPSGADLTLERELEITPAYSIHFIYEDGARDAESLGIDVKERAAYLLTKRDETPRLYRLPLAPAAAGQPAAARFLGPVPHLPKPTELQRAVRMPSHGFRGWPTAMTFAPDGRLAVVLVYEQPLLFSRQAGESWTAALQREPTKLPPHKLPQAEAVCFSTDGRAIYVGSEKTADLLRYDQP